MFFSIIKGKIEHFQFEMLGHSTSETLFISAAVGYLHVCVWGGGGRGGQQLWLGWCGGDRRVVVGKEIELGINWR